MTFFQGILPNPTPTNTRVTGNTATTVVAAQGRSQNVALVRIANVDGTDAVIVTLDIYDGTNATQLISTYSLAADSLPVEMRDILLEQGESLRVTSGDAGGQLHVHAIHSQANVPGQ